MNIQQFDELAALVEKMEFAEDGETILNYKDFEWRGENEQEWNRNFNEYFCLDDMFANIEDRDEIRYNPKPKYRPFKNGEEFFPHKDRWICPKTDDLLNHVFASKVNSFGATGTFLGHSDVITSYERLLSTFDFLNDDFTTEPCGVLEEC